MALECGVMGPIYIRVRVRLTLLTYKLGKLLNKWSIKPYTIAHRLTL